MCSLLYTLVASTSCLQAALGGSSFRWGRLELGYLDGRDGLDGAGVAEGLAVARDHRDGLGGILGGVRREERGARVRPGVVGAGVDRDRVLPLMGCMSWVRRVAEPMWMNVKGES